MKILIAGEEQALSVFLKQNLEIDGYEVECLTDAGAVLSAVGAKPPDLLILALSSLEVATSKLAWGTEATKLAWGTEATNLLGQVRSIDHELPILVLSARRDVDSRVLCLDRGADDCMIKPLSLRELKARCRRLLRRRPGQGAVLRWDGIELDRMRHRVEHEGRPVDLTPKEFAVLEYLMMHRGSCISRAALLAQVWTEGSSAGSNVVDVYINYLRRKLVNGDRPSMIRTVRGLGYRLGEGQPGALPPV